MASDPQPSRHDKIVVGLLISVCFGLSGFSLAWTFNANADLKVLELKVENLKEKVKRIERDSERDHNREHLRPGGN